MVSMGIVLFWAESVKRKHSEKMSVMVTFLMVKWFYPKIALFAIFWKVTA
jgi:hypothetical protein